MKKLLIVFIICMFVGTVSAEIKRFAIPIDASPFIGQQNAPVTIVEFIDYQ
jgi:protein-disulfide isomerase